MIMNISHPSRRSFLSSLAILSAGTALGSVTKFFNDNEQSLEDHWKQFCLKSGAQHYPASTSTGSDHLIQPCKGHFYTTGIPVLIANSNMVAVPIWISWGKKKNKPDDIVISFLQKGTQQKIGSINRFELIALTSASQADQVTLIQDLTSKNFGVHRNPGNHIKTHVQKGKYSQIDMNIAGNKTSIKNTIIYNS